MACALGVLALACDHRHEGRSYGLAAERSHCVGVLKGTLHDGKRATVHVADGEAKLSAGAPKETEGFSDVNWGIVGSGGHVADEQGYVPLLGAGVTCADVMALAVTNNGGAVLLEVKLTGSFAPSSAEQEALAMLKLSHKMVYLRTVAARCGAVQTRPSMLLCDAAASLRVAAGEISAARLRHALRHALRP